jgi:MFS family permease
VIGAPISGLILNLEGTWGLHGWQWMFIIEALPALAMAVAVYFYLTDWPGEAHWLMTEERQWLQNRLEGERANRDLKLPRFDGHGNSNEKRGSDGSKKEAHYL